MNAVILAGGFGNRLLPFTSELPKPALCVGNVPMIDYTVGQLAHFGVRDLVFALAHLPERIIEWTVGYKDLTCHYNIESAPLGTLGAVLDASAYLDETFFVLSGDGISDIDLGAMKKRHFESGADVTIAVTSVKNPWLYGVVKTDSQGFVTEFREKPQRLSDIPVSSGSINCGVYIINKSVLKDVKKGTCVDFARDLFPRMLSYSQKIATYFHGGYWSDVGSLESYHATNLDIVKRGAFFDAPPNILRKHFQSRILNEQSSLVGRTSSVAGRIFDCCIGNDCKILSSAVLNSCVVLDGVTVHGRHSNCIIDAKFAVDVLSCAKSHEYLHQKHELLHQKEESEKKFLF